MPAVSRDVKEPRRGSNYAQDRNWVERARDLQYAGMSTTTDQEPRISVIGTSGAGKRSSVTSSGRALLRWSGSTRRTSTRFFADGA